MFKGVFIKVKSIYTKKHNVIYRAHALMIYEY